MANSLSILSPKALASMLDPIRDYILTVLN